LNWWRDYFGPYARCMLPEKPKTYHVRPEGETWNKLTWTIAWVISPFCLESSEFDERRFEHAVLVGRELDYTWALIPEFARDRRYLESEALQRHWLLFGWYKHRGCTEHVLAVNFNLPRDTTKVYGVTYEFLRKLANTWQGRGFVLGGPEAKSWDERRFDIWIPPGEELDALMSEVSDLEEE